MSFLPKVLLQVRSPIHELKRFRGKINIQRPRKPFYTRQLVETACKPHFFKGKNIPEMEKCSNLQKPLRIEIDNPFEHILAKECGNWFNHSRMIAFMHANPIPIEQKHAVYGELAKQNMHLRTYGKKIIKMALEGTHYEEVYKLFVSHTQIVFSEDEQVKNFLKIIKKAPQYTLIAGIVDEKFVSRNEFMAYAELPSLDVARAQLCQVFKMNGSNIVQQLTKQQSALVGHLDHYVQLQGQENNTTPSSLKDEEKPNDLVENKSN